MLRHGKPASVALPPISLMSPIRPEVDGDILFVYAKDEDTVAKIEDEFALRISIFASKI